MPAPRAAPSANAFAPRRASAPRTFIPSLGRYLWKDNARGIREINLDPDAQGILLAPDSLPAIRRAADGRSPELDTSDLRLAEVTQLRAAVDVPD